MVEYKFCPYINDGDDRCKVELPKCSNGYEMCSLWYDKLNGLEEEVLGIGAMMISPEKLHGGKNGRRKTQLYSRR